MLIPNSITPWNPTPSQLLLAGELVFSAKWVTWNGKITLLEPTWVKLL